MAVSWPLAAAVSWFQNQFISAPVAQANITDPLNDLNTRVAALTTDSGTVSITPVANTPTSATIVFNKTFPSVPIVQVTFNGAASTITNVSYDTVSTTGCKVYVTRTNTTATTVSWFAVVTP